MKKLIMLLLPALALFNACEPVRTDNPMGGVLSAGELKVRADNPGGSNKVTLINETPGVTVQWNYLIGVAVGDKIEVTMPFGGEIPIKLTAFCDGGIVESSTSVNITNMDAAVAPEWSLFAGKAGTSGKTWVWDPTPGMNVWGTSGYLVQYAPGWSTAKVGGTLSGQFIDPVTEVTFDLNGGANLTITDGNGTRKGSFAFDMTKTKKAGNGTPWSIGQITTSGVTMPAGVICWANPPLNTYDIIVLNEDTLVLGAAAAGTGEWGEATFWMFKLKE